MSQPLFVFGGRHWPQRMAPSTSFFFPLMCKVACPQRLEQCTARLAGCAPLAAKCISETLSSHLRICKCEQCAKVDPNISLISARERSTEAAGRRSNPCEVVAGRARRSQPPRNRHLVRFAGSYSVFEIRAPATKPVPCPEGLRW